MIFYFDEVSGEVGVLQWDSFGAIRTTFTLLDGSLYLDGTPIAGPAVAAVAAVAVASTVVGASGTFVDKYNNTITVVDGLITDLGQ